MKNESLSSPSGLVEKGPRDIIARSFTAGLPEMIRSLRLALTTADLPGALHAATALQAASHGAEADELEDLAQKLVSALDYERTRTDPCTALPTLAASHMAAIDQQVERHTFLHARG